MISLSGLASNLLAEGSSYSRTVSPKSTLPQYVNYTRIVDSLIDNYNLGRFTENGIPTTRAFFAGSSILDLLGEFYHIDSNYTITALGSIQGLSGGVKFNLEKDGEYSYTEFYIVNGATKLGYDPSEIANFNETSFTGFIQACFSTTSGGFGLEPGDPANIYANWMILQVLTKMNALEMVDLEKNLEYCETVLDIDDAQNLFSVMASYVLAGRDPQIQFHTQMPSIVDQLQEVHLSSSNYFDRYYALTTLELLGTVPKSYATPVYLEECINALELELDGFQDINSIFTKLAIVALLVGEVTTVQLLLTPAGTW